MTLHHDLHMARLRIARLEEALRFYAEKHAYIPTGWYGDLNPSPVDQDLGGRARAALTQPASSPRPAPDPCAASEARPEPKA
jgi:hypothetical protein